MGFPYTEDRKDASGAQQLQASLIVGSAVLLVRIHHRHVEGAGLPRGQKLIWGGGQVWLSPQPQRSEAPAQASLGAVTIQGTFAWRGTVPPSMWPHGSCEARGQGSCHCLKVPPMDLVTSARPVAPLGKWCQGPFHSVCSPSVSRAGFSRRSILCSSSACERSGVRASKSFILELGVARLQGPQMCGTLTCLHRGRPSSGGPGFTSQVTTRPAGGSAKANARAE